MDFGSVEVTEDTRDAGARGSKIVASAAGSFEFGEFSWRRITCLYYFVNIYRVVFIRMTLPSIRIHFLCVRIRFPVVRTFYGALPRLLCEHTRECLCREEPRRSDRAKPAPARSQILAVVTVMKDTQSRDV